jgi:hypothetical protein
LPTGDFAVTLEKRINLFWQVLRQAWPQRVQVLELKRVPQP